MPLDKKPFVSLIEDGLRPLLPLLDKDRYLKMVYRLHPSSFGFLNNLSLEMQSYVKLTIALLFFGITAFLPLDLDHRAHMSLAIFVFIALLWTFEPIPMPVTALLVPVLLTAFGIYGTNEALEPFANPIVYLLLGGVFLAAAVNRTGFDKRLLYPLLIRSGGRVDRFLLSMMLVAGILSMWISNTATTALLIPFAISLSATVEDTESRERLTKLLLIGIGVAATIGGMGTVIGSSPNAITTAMLAEEGSWTFLDWMIVGMPTSFILLFLSWKIILKVLPPPGVNVDTGLLEREYLLMGSLSGGEKKTMVIFGFAIVFWVSGARIGGMLGFTDALMSAAMVSLLATILLFVTQTISWDDASKVPWGVFLILGAGLALGQAIIDTGAAVWVTGHIFDVTSGMPLILIILLVCVIMVVISNFLSNTASAAVFIPILIALSGEMNANMRLLVLPAALVLSLSFITPIGTPPITLIYSLGTIRRAELAKIGILVAIPSVFICIGMVYLLTWIGII